MKTRQAGLFRFVLILGWLPLLLFAGAAPAGEAAGAAPPLALQLSDRDGAVVYSAPVAVGERFAVVFTHSLALSRVEEIFEVIAAGEFRLRETLYADFGAGLPHEERPGLKMEFANGRIRLGGYDVPFREVWLRIGHIADHRLMLPNGREIRLAAFRPAGTAIGIRVVEGRCNP